MSEERRAVFVPTFRRRRGFPERFTRMLLGELPPEAREDFCTKVDEVIESLWSNVRSAYNAKAWDLVDYYGKMLKDLQSMRTACLSYTRPRPTYPREKIERTVERVRELLRGEEEVPGMGGGGGD